jgi:hypothetical protein
MPSYRQLDLARPLGLETTHSMRCFVHLLKLSGNICLEDQSSMEVSIPDVSVASLRLSPCCSS